VSFVVGIPPSGYGSVDPRGRAAIDTPRCSVRAQRHLDEVHPHARSAWSSATSRRASNAWRNRAMQEQAVVLATETALLRHGRDAGAPAWA